MASAKPSIAVLPFNNYGGDEATGRLADGLTEDIITDLSRMSEFDVIARNSTEVYKGKSADVRQIGRDLNVRYVLEGSIQRQGERIRATAQLIDAQTGAHVWSESWDRPVQDVFAVQTEIADHILSQFEMSTGPIKSADLGVARRKRPQSLTAYDLNLLGVEKQLEPDPRERRGVDGDSQARRSPPIRTMPAPGSISPGRTTWLQITAPTGRIRTGQQLEAAERAVALDPNDAEAHAVLGDMLGFRGEFGRAKTELDIALRLNPGSASDPYLLPWLGEHLR